MGKREINGGAPTKYHKMKHDEMKPNETNEAKFTNIQRAQQAQAYRMDCTARNRTLPAKQLS